MKILVDGGNSGSGGYVRYLSGVLGSRQLEGVEVLLVCSPGLAERLGPLDTQVTLAVEPELDSPRRWTRLAWWRRTWPRLLADFRPDVVLHPTGLLRGRSGGVPTVVIHHVMAPFMPVTYRLYGPSRITAELLFWRTRLLRSFRRADGVIFHADYTRRTVVRQAGSIARSTLVPNAVPPEFTGRYDRDTTVLSTPVRLLCVSTLYLFKYQWNVVAAVAQLRSELGLDIHLDLVGGGEPRARKKLLRSVDRHDGRTWTTVREVPAKQMLAVYEQADVFVFPSADETWPITLLEAMASGLPIACADRMAMPEMLRDAGRYFDPEDPISMANALRPLLTDAALRTQCSQRAQEYAAEFTWERSAAGVVAFLRRVHEEVR